MTSKTVEVPNISCAGCVQAIKLELGQLTGVASVNGDAMKRTIEVEYEAPATWDAIVSALNEIEYPPVQA